MQLVAHVVSGILLGYAVASLMESSLHRAIHHAGPQIRRLWARYPRMSAPFRRVYFSHAIVHHRWTFRRDFVTQFSSCQEKAWIDARIQPPHNPLIRREQYGLTLRGIGLVWFNLPMVPWVCLVGMVFGPWVLAGTLPGFAAYSCITKFVHPSLHLPYDDIVRGPFLLRWMLQTGYVKFLRRYHYLHHRYPDCNFNLLLGADFVLGRYRAPSAQDLHEMVRLGLMADDRRSRARVAPIREA